MISFKAAFLFIMDKPSYYAIIPANVRYDEELKDKAKLLYAEITALSNKDGVCFASNSYFASLYSVTERTIQNLIDNLVEKGYLTRVFTIDKKRILSITGVRKKFHGGDEKIFTHNNTRYNKKKSIKEKDSFQGEVNF